MNMGKRKKKKRGINRRSVPPSSPLAAMLLSAVVSGILGAMEVDPVTVSFDVHYIDGESEANARIRQRRTNRLLDALSKALEQGDAVTVERIKSVLSQLNPPVDAR